MPGRRCTCRRFSASRCRTIEDRLDIRAQSRGAPNDPGRVRSVRRVVDDVRPDVICLSSAFRWGTLEGPPQDVPCVSFTHGIEASSLVTRLSGDDSRVADMSTC